MRMSAYSFYPCICKKGPYAAFIKFGISQPLYEVPEWLCKRKIFTSCTLDVEQGSSSRYTFLYMYTRSWYSKNQHVWDVLFMHSGMHVRISYTLLCPFEQNRTKQESILKAMQWRLCSVFKDCPSTIPRHYSVGKHAFVNLYIFFLLIRKYLCRSSLICSI